MTSNKHLAALVLLAAGIAGSPAAGAGTLPVVPLVTCSFVLSEIDELWAAMGYHNPNQNAVSLPLGAFNFFSPSPIARGQPTVFQPGLHNSAFAVTFSPDLFRQMEWNLDGGEAVVTANTPRCITAALALSVSGQGSVQAGNAPACSDSCIQTVDPPADVALAATPVAGWTFAGFSGDADCADGQLSLAGGSVVSCRAEFVPNPTRRLALAPLGPGRIEIDGSGIACPPGPCIVELPAGSPLLLRAEAEAGALFVDWLGDENCLEGTPLLDQDTVCTALFDDDQDLLFLDGFESPAAR